MDLYQQVIHKSRYARWNDTEKRREHWDETVGRYFNFFEEHLGRKHPKATKWYKTRRPELEKAVLDMEIMPSMRCMMTAGKALERDHVAGYNCSYAPIDDIRAFDELMYILLCGTGVGFSVESRYVGRLPSVPDSLSRSDKTILVEDSKIGWATAYRELLGHLYAGYVPKWDLTKIRPAGARLKTFGGRASGPGPLDELFNFTVETFRKAAGRKLSTLECHDLACKIGDVVVVGGVRRSALISLSDLNDDLMRHAKTGEWWKEHPHRQLANNSAVYDGKVPFGVFLKEWVSLYESHSGERGIFNRASARFQAGRGGRRDTDQEFGTNPCSEIILRPHQFCNLSEVVVRSDDSQRSLSRKVALATDLGSIQSTLTDFRYLRKVWRTNTEEERLLGVSLTGILDNSEVWNKGVLPKLRDNAVASNKHVAKLLGIPASKAITCVKPSGTVSQLVNSASGIHPRHSPFYVRTIRCDKKDPMANFMQANGFPCEPAIGKEDSTLVFSFPIKSPDGAATREQLTAIEHLTLWKKFQDEWCEHKPSVTISVKEDEWLEVGDWVYKNLSKISGVSFLPYSEHVYKQAPYTECSREEYEALVAKMPKTINWNELATFESEDTTTGSQELACTGGSCEIN